MFRCACLMRILLLSCVAIPLYAADSTTDKPAAKNGEVAKTSDKAKDPERQRLIAGVAESLKRMMLPSDYAKQLKDMTFDAAPYYKIIKGANNKSTLVYRCRFTTAKSMVNAVETMLSAQGIVESSTEQNLLIINDASGKMDELKDALLAMDVNVPQVLVEAKILEVMFSDGMQRNISVIWNQTNAKQNLTSSAGSKTTVPDQTASDKNLGGDMDWYPVTSGSIGDSNYSNLQTTMQWLLTADDAKILSAPNVIVSRNTTARIVTGNDIPIQTIQVVSGSTTTSTEFKRIGVQLSVTPSLINDDYTTLQVNPQVSTVQRYETIKQGDSSYPVPVIAIRNIETQLTVKDGQVILLGGLYSSRDTNYQEKNPFVSDIPWLGDLFAGKNVSREITQLIFILKVSILTPREMAEGVIYDPGKEAENIRNIGTMLQTSPHIFPKQIDNVEDKVKGVLRYEDGTGNVDTVGNKVNAKDGSVPPLDQKKPAASDKADKNVTNPQDSGNEKKYSF